MRKALPVTWNDVSYAYPGEQKPVMQGFSLSLQAGERVVLMGSSGCGKSTLGLMLNGIIPNQTGGEFHGEVRLGELDPRATPLATMASQVGLVFQDPDSQLCTINIRDEIAFGPQNLLVDRESILERLEEAAGLVGLADRLQDSVFDLSGGQKQRVAIAAAMVMRPAVLVLDEPTANLDPWGRSEVLRVMASILRDEPMTTIVIEHHPGELLQVSDRLVVIGPDGAVLQGKPRSLIAEHGENIRTMGIRLPAPALFWLGVGDKQTRLPLTIGEIDFDRFGSAHGKAPVSRMPRRSTAEPVLAAEGVRFSYDGRREILKGLDFSLAPGEIVALLGQNGSGKSTFASLLSGLNRPGQGTISVSGRNTRKIPIHEISRELAYVFQYPEHQFITDRVYDEIAISLRRLARPADEVDGLVQDSLRRFDLAHLADKHPFRLSLGQKRRLSIAAMAVYRPKVLVLDEPTFGQDQAHTDDLAQIIADLARDGVGIIMITHDLKLTADIADRAVVLSDGRIAFDDTPVELFETLEHEQRWGLDRLEEYSLWRELARRVPDLPFDADSYRLGTQLARRIAA